MLLLLPIAEHSHRTVVWCSLPSCPEARKTTSGLWQDSVLPLDSHSPIFHGTCLVQGRMKAIDDNQLIFKSNFFKWGTIKLIGISFHTLTFTNLNCVILNNLTFRRPCLSILECSTQINYGLPGGKRWRALGQTIRHSYADQETFIFLTISIFESHLNSCTALLVAATHVKKWLE